MPLIRLTMKLACVNSDLKLIQFFSDQRFKTDTPRHRKRLPGRLLQCLVFPYHGLHHSCLPLMFEAVALPGNGHDMGMM
jgi:hypothetical protein